MNLALWTGVQAMVVAGLAAPVVYRALLALKSRQTVSPHIGEHAHKQGTPTMGGLIILVGALVGVLLMRRSGAVSMLPPLFLLVGFGLVGFLDDFVVPRMWPGKRGLGWLPKLALEIVATVSAGYVMELRDPVHLAIYAFIVLFYSNAYNFADGLDGLAGGIAVILGVGLIAVRWQETPWDAYFPMIGIVAGALPFLVLNAPPAKVFMGDVGALPIGAVLGHTALLPFLGTGGFTQNLGNQWIVVGIGVMSLLMLLELLPVPIQIGWVKLFKRRAFNFKTPIHHAFQEKGWPETRIVYLFHIVQAGLVVLGVSVAVGTGSAL